LQEEAMKTRIMYVERKDDVITGPAWIGRVSFSKSGQSVYFRGRRLQTLSGAGFKANYFDAETGAEYWVSGCKKFGGDRLYPGTIEIDDEVREEYWSQIRLKPENSGQRVIRCTGKHGGKAKRLK
jgi:hypothetical protein